MTTLNDRIRSAMSLATGTQQHTPDEAFFAETNARGRWQADYDAGAQQVAYAHKRHPDGTCDTVKLEATSYNQWLEMGGLAGRDVAAGRI